MPTTPRGFPMLTEDQRYALVVDYNKLATKADAEATVTEARAQETADAAKAYAQQAADRAAATARDALSKVEPVRALVDAANAKSDHAVTTAEAAYAYNEALGSGDVKAQVDAVVLDTASESGALVASKADAGVVSIDPTRYGVTWLPDGGGAGALSTDGLLAAIEAAKSVRNLSGGQVSARVHLPAWLKVDRDIVLDTDGVTITGEGPHSGLLLVGCSVVIDGTTAETTRQQLRDLRIRRITGSGMEHGPAVDVRGGGMNQGKYPYRYSLAHLHIESPINANGINPEKSVALRMRGTFLATITDVYLRSAYQGLVIDYDSQVGNLSANAITFVGGEIQAVRRLGAIRGAIGITFLGMAWEGASEAGMDVDDTHGLTIVGAYMEANAEYDLRVGEVAPVSGLAIHGGTSSTGAKSATRVHSVILRRAKAVSISGVHWSAHLNGSPVLVDEATAGAVNGAVTACSTSVAKYPVVEVLNGRDWGNVTVDRLLEIRNPNGVAQLQINGTAGQQRTIRYETGDVARWVEGANAISESGANAGTDWELTAYSDTGSFLGQVMRAYRSDLRLRVYGPLHHTGSTLGFAGKAPITPPTLPATGATVDQVVKALSDLGLVTRA